MQTPDFLQAIGELDAETFSQDNPEVRAECAAEAIDDFIENETSLTPAAKQQLEHLSDFLMQINAELKQKSVLIGQLTEENVEFSKKKHT